MAFIVTKKFSIGNGSGTLFKKNVSLSVEQRNRMTNQLNELAGKANVSALGIDVLAVVLAWLDRDDIFFSLSYAGYLDGEWRKRAADAFIDELYKHKWRFDLDNGEYLTIY